jgi:hypothetical protein
VINGTGNTWLKWIAIVMILATGVIHAIEIPDHFKAATYLGVLFILNAIGAVVAAVGIFMDEFSWGWSLGLIIAGGAFVMFLISRTIGLPSFNPDEWGALGIASLVVEGIYVIDYGIRVAQEQQTGGQAT